MSLQSHKSFANFVQILMKDATFFHNFLFLISFFLVINLSTMMLLLCCCWLVSMLFDYVVEVFVFIILFWIYFIVFILLYVFYFTSFIMDGWLQTQIALLGLKINLNHSVISQIIWKSQQWSNLLSGASLFHMIYLIFFQNKPPKSHLFILFRCIMQI